MGDVTFSGASLVVVSGLLSALVATIVALFRLLMASKDVALNDMTNQRDSYQRMAAQSIAALELAANRARKARGEGPFQPIPPVVPEHNSPTTEGQLATAEYQTLLARATRAGRLLDIPMEALTDEAAPSTDLLNLEIEFAETVHEVVLKPGESATITAVSEQRQVPDDESP